MRGLSPRDLVFAEAGAVASRFEWSRRKVRGPRIERVTELPFHVAHTTVDELPTLMRFRGDPSRSREQKRLPVGILAVGGMAVRAAREVSPNAEIAYAWNYTDPDGARGLGRAILYARLPQEQLDSQLATLGGAVLAGVCIGKTDLRASLVAALPDGTLMQLVRTPEDQAPVNAGLPQYQPLYPSIAAVPAEIPIY